MAEITKDMYGAVGKFGNKVFYRRGDKTFVKSIAKPKNPKTGAQSLQRVLLKTVNKTYSMMKGICNHSFEEYTNSFESMNKFKRVNLKYLRERAATLLESGQGLDAFYQFTPLESEKWTPFEAIISEGHLPVVSVGIDGSHSAYVCSPGRTYADFVARWGLQRGDMATFVTVQKRNDTYMTEIARLVLKPCNADGSGAPMSTEIVNSQGLFPCPDTGNQLNFANMQFDSDRFRFVLGRGGDVVAAGIIISRETPGGNWLRSNCQLVIDPAGFGSDLCSLAKAVEYSYKTHKIDTESDLYPNNADGE